MTVSTDDYTQLCSGKNLADSDEKIKQMEEKIKNILKLYAKETKEKKIKYQDKQLANGLRDTESRKESKRQ